MNFSRLVWLGFLVGGSLVAAEEALPPPRDTPLVEVAANQVRTDDISDLGQKALKIDPEKWKNAETPNFYVHFRRYTEAKKVAREIEYDRSFIMRQLGARVPVLNRRSHVFVFGDVGEWAKFVSEAGVPEWSASFARGDELFLNVREKEGFDSHLLAHETTHAIISLVYQSQQWPLWLNEGFAEYIGSAAVADRKNQSLRRHQSALSVADMPLAELTNLKTYPSDLMDVARLYQTGEKFVRFLMAKGKPAQFVSFVDALLNGKTLPEAVMADYAAEFPTYEKFEAEFAKYSVGKR